MSSSIGSIETSPLWKIVQAVYIETSPCGGLFRFLKKSDTRLVVWVVGRDFLQVLISHVL